MTLGRLLRICFLLLCMLSKAVSYAAATSAPASSYNSIFRLISAEMPFYPETARQCRIVGVVELIYTLDRDGNVTDVRPLGMWPTDQTLEKAATADVKTWKFRWYSSAPLSSTHQTEFVYKLSDKVGYTTEITVRPGRIVVEADEAAGQRKCAPSPFTK